MIFWSLATLGRILESMGRLDEAKTLLETSINIYEVRYGKLHPDLSRTLSVVGRVYEQQRDTAKIVANYEEMLSVRIQTLGESHPATGAAFAKQGLSYAYTGEYDKAEEYMLKGLGLREGRGEMFNNELYKDLAFLYEQTNQPDKAVFYKSKIKEAF